MEQLGFFALDMTPIQSVTCSPALDATSVAHTNLPIAFRLPAEGRQLASTWKGRAIDNLAAIRLARTLRAEQRAATTDEMRLLARYVGFGATDLAKNLFPIAGATVTRGWEDLHAAFCELIDERERASLARSTQYAHFTPDYLTRAIFDAVVRLGFTGGHAIEPGCGVGLFMAAAPEAIANAITWTGFEMDATTAAIAQLLQPNAKILNQDFTKARAGTQADLAIGNPPFAKTHVVGEGPAGRLKLRLHDYFIARSLEMLRAGGLGAFVTSHGTMDKLDPKARHYIGTLANLIGALRLPQGSMNEQAGTEVVVDILFFKRREYKASNVETWADVVEVQPCAGVSEKPMFVNRYFAEHPEMVLGRHEWTTSPFGPTYTCRGDVRTIESSVNDAIDRLPQIKPRGAVIESAPKSVLPSKITVRNTLQVSSPGTVLDLFGTATTQTNNAAPSVSLTSTLGLSRAERERDATAYELKEGSFTFVKDELYQLVDGGLVRIPVKSTRSEKGIYPKAGRVIRAFVAVRNALRAVITAQVAGDDDENTAAQERLRKAYRAFVGEFGPINLTNTTYRTDPETGEESSTQRRPNLAPVLDDPDCWLVASIERYDPETGIATMGPIFSEKVIGAAVTPEIHSAADALAAVLDSTGRVDIDAIAKLRGVDREAAIAELGDRIYALPEKPGTWVTADEYLSGKVRAKLETALALLPDNPELQRNVDALERAKPQDLNPSDVTARLGSPWIPTSDIEAFIRDKMGIETTIKHSVDIATWDVDFVPFINRPSATSEWGTPRRHAGKLLHDALHGVTPQIFDKHFDGNREVRVLNPVETEAAREKLARIQEAFSSWIWTDQDRAMRLMRLYNDTYNDIVPREFDGSHLQLRGSSSAFRLYPHQKRAIWRVISSGSTYIAHSVGAGKTMSIAAAVMEQRRLGLISKPMLTVPAHCLAQFTIEWLQMYPTAQLLVADEQNFEKSKRDRFVARAATGNWDCIIITHSAFKLIPTPTEFEQKMIEDQIWELESLSKTEHGDGMTRKRLEQRKEALRMRLESLIGRKDDMVTIAELGIDQIIVDEAQAFRKLSFVTSGGTIKGIDPDGSQRAWDLYVKIKYVEKLRPKRAVILASGTPVTNTLGEMFTIQRYMNEAELFERNIHEFDAWKAMFGETVTELELQPGGQYKPVTRFAQFINVPELVAMFRTFADVVQRKDLRDLIKLPSIAGGQRTVVTAEATPAFKAYQQYLARRIHAIENRQGKPAPGDDIILSVITDGRHAAIDVRLVDPLAGNEETNKLNALVRNVFDIYQRTSNDVYTDVDGTLSATRGSLQMIFSDLGTPAVAERRGFSAYDWIRSELIRLGVPSREIAFMQNYKKTADKQALFSACRQGRVRILIGSTETMGTGVNAQKRLKALHHLDVPWLPSDVEQREGRIERQGNENDEIEIYAYATPGSMDASMWQTLERKSRFIGMAMSGDKSVRRLEDAASQANSFAIAKAIASGNPLLMQKAGLEGEIARLRRLRSAHYDDQHALHNTIATGRDRIRIKTAYIEDLKQSLAAYKSTKGDNFSMTVFETTTNERKTAGAYLFGKAHTLPEQEPMVVGTLGGLNIVGVMKRSYATESAYPEYGVAIGETIHWTGPLRETSPAGLIQRLEHVGFSLNTFLEEAQHSLTTTQRRVTEAQSRIGRDFEHQAELDEKLAQLRTIEDELIAESRRAEEALREAMEAARASAVSDDEDDGSAAA